MVQFQIKVAGEDEIKQWLGEMLDAKMMSRINKEVAFNAQEQTADHIAQASVSRHKTAQRLGAKPTDHFEFAPIRVMDTPTKYDEKGATIYIYDTPGILRAFGPVEVSAKNARALTIPIHRIAYGKRVADVKAEGYNIFRMHGTSNDKGVLFGKKGEDVVPLYALRKRVTLPEDKGLLPTGEQYADRALDVIDAFIAHTLS